MALAGTSYLRKQPKGYGGIDGARKLLNDMIFESKIGTTDSNGKFETNNSLLFPTLYNYPSIAITNEKGDYLGPIALNSPIYNNLKI